MPTATSSVTCGPASGARSGAGIAIVGDPDQVAGKLREIRDAGVDTFILSGYPHLAECELVARNVLPRLRKR